LDVFSVLALNLLYFQQRKTAEVAWMTGPAAGNSNDSVHLNKYQTQGEIP